MNEILVWLLISVGSQNTSGMVVREFKTEATCQYSAEKLESAARVKRGAAYLYGLCIPVPKE